MNRIDLLNSFLKEQHITNYELKKVAGDASFRHYFRIHCHLERSEGSRELVLGTPHEIPRYVQDDKTTFIIMDAPPEFEDLKPFCQVGEFLLSHNFSAPKIFASDFKNGFLLLEDFGDNSYRKIIEQNPQSEYDLYEQAIDTLVKLNQITPPHNLPHYDENLLLKEVMLFIDWYLPHILKKPASKIQIQEFQNIWLNLFSKLSAPKVVTLRDYHADNLMVLKNKKVGLLDFQDAVIGVPAYDVVSLLTDARRNVVKNLSQEMLKHYLEKSSCEPKQFMLDYEILSLQRNIKIIGIFSRLAIRDGKNQYLYFLPRVFSYVNSALEDNSKNDQFSELKKFLSIFI